MADRGGPGTYTPTRKPRRGRGTGGGNTPRGSPRGRGGGDNGESSPSVSSTSSPAAQERNSPPSVSVPVPVPESKPPVTVTVTPVTPTQEKRSPEKRVSVPKEEPTAPPPASEAKMESPQDKAVTSASSIETFSTPTSFIDDKTMSPEGSKASDKIATDEPKAAEPKVPTETPLEKSKLPGKPPRKISQPDKVPKIFEPAVEKPSTPRPSGDPPLTVEIQAEPDTIKPVATDSATVGSQGPVASGSRPSSRGASKAAVSPAGFAYGLGGPVGKPGYGVSNVLTPGDEDDPWPAITAKTRRASIADITKAAKGFTARQWTTIIIFGLADMFSAMIISLQAPFYPPEAESKGATATEYGLVFGVYELTVFLVSPFYGKFMNKLGPKLVFNLGITMTSISCICFGLLDKVDDHIAFVALSFLLRITEAVGAAAFVTSSFSIIACEFPESVATTFASLETFFGLGLIVGPTFGGALYQLGGYMLPFAVTGASLLFLTALSAFVMPKIETISDDEGNTATGFGIFSILKFPSVFLAALSITISASTLAFLSATLEPHLRQFTLTPVQTGLMFIINGGVYAICAPLLGWICDKSQRPALITVFGAFLIFISFLLIGPASFVPLNTMLWLTGVGLGVHGIGLAGSFVAGFISALRDSLEFGLPDNISTYGVVSGLWTSSLALGAFVGPSIGGFLLDQVGFRDATYFPLITELIFLIVLIAFMTLFKPKLKSGVQTDSEAAPLLPSTLLSGEQKDLDGPSTSGYGATRDSY